MTALAALPAPTLSDGEFRSLQRLARTLGPAALSRRRRRLLFLALAAPGFIAVFAAPLHRNFAVLVAGLLAFAAACVFRARSEPLFVRAEAAALWPPDLPPHRPETPHA
ncbi:MAG: hypothetical protein JO303_15285 [Caulobacteraceae bacterium]|nr:hypothetical protein [Caulobacteraceae bacterium]